MTHYTCPACESKENTRIARARYSCTSCGVEFGFPQRQIDRVDRQNRAWRRINKIVEYWTDQAYMCDDNPGIDEAFGKLLDVEGMAYYGSSYHAEFINGISLDLAKDKIREARTLIRRDAK